MSANRVLFGCSYPVRMERLTHGVEFMNSLDVSDEEKKLMFGQNAQKLFNISYGEGIKGITNVNILTKSDFKDIIKPLGSGFRRNKMHEYHDYRH